MKVVMFILSLLVLICASGMFYGAIIKDSPMYYTGIILMSAVFLLSVALTMVTYKELLGNLVE